MEEDNKKIDFEPLLQEYKREENLEEILDQYRNKLTSDVVKKEIKITIEDLVQLYNIMIVNDRIVYNAMTMLLESMPKNKDMHQTIEKILEEQKDRIELFLIEMLHKNAGEL